MSVVEVNNDALEKAKTNIQGSLQRVAKKVYKVLDLTYANLSDSPIHIIIIFTITLHASYNKRTLNILTGKTVGGREIRIFYYVEFEIFNGFARRRERH